jgi:hypothetical protein
MSLRRDRKPKPLGVCTVCRDYTDEHIRMNHRCIRVHGGRRCSGIYRSSLTVVWNECPTCRAMGSVGSQKCGECAGWGWLLHSMR